MKKRMLCVSLAVAVCLSVIGFTGCSQKETDTSSTSQQEDYPMIALIDDTYYYGTGEICEQVPKLAPAGAIECVVPKEIMPDTVNSANFGNSPMEYLFLEDGTLIIKVDENWYIFEEQH